MVITVRGKRWRLICGGIRRGAAYCGVCDPPDATDKKIRICGRLRGKDRLEVVIHEVLHAGLWDLDEPAVRELATDMARTLTRLGYCCPAEKAG